MTAAPTPTPPMDEDWKDYTFDLSIRRIKRNNMLAIRLKKTSGLQVKNYTVTVRASVFVKKLLTHGLIRLEDLK